MKKFIAIIILISSYSCQPQMNSGLIINKWHEETIIDNSGEIIVFDEFTSKTIIYDEDFVLVVKGVVEKDTISKRFEVSKSDYEKYAIYDSIYFKRDIVTIFNAWY